MSMLILPRVVLGLLALVGAAAIGARRSCSPGRCGRRRPSSLFTKARRRSTIRARPTSAASRPATEPGSPIGSYPAIGGARDRIADSWPRLLGQLDRDAPGGPGARQSRRERGRARLRGHGSVGNARRHRLSRATRRRPRRSRRRTPKSQSGRPVLAHRPFGGRRVRASDRRQPARRYVRSLRAARPLSRLFARRPTGRRRGLAGGLRPTCRASSRR